MITQRRIYIPAKNVADPAGANPNFILFSHFTRCCVVGRPYVKDSTVYRNPYERHGSREIHDALRTQDPDLPVGRLLFQPVHCVQPVQHNLFLDLFASELGFRGHPIRPKN